MVKGDVIRGVLVALVYLDLTTIGLRQVPALSSLDFLPLVLIPVNIIENCLIATLILAWPNRYSEVAKVLVVLISFVVLLKTSS